MQEFNVDSKSECDQFNLAHETKTKNASADFLSQCMRSQSTNVTDGRTDGRTDGNTVFCVALRGQTIH